eukprot:15124631-Alexandrium_andersonii.AAC.1
MGSACGQPPILGLDGSFDAHRRLSARSVGAFELRPYPFAGSEQSAIFSVRCRSFRSFDRTRRVTH